jgi:hypothetical protein
LAVTYRDNQDYEPGLVFLEDDPIGPDAEAIKGVFNDPIFHINNLI